jgi:hypothetical protein
VAEFFGFFLDLDANASKVDPTAGSVVKTPVGPTPDREQRFDSGSGASGEQGKQ